MSSVVFGVSSTAKQVPECRLSPVKYQRLMEICTERGLGWLFSTCLSQIEAHQKATGFIGEYSDAQLERVVDATLTEFEAKQRAELTQKELELQRANDPANMMVTSAEVYLFKHQQELQQQLQDALRRIEVLERSRDEQVSKTGSVSVVRK